MHFKTTSKMRKLNLGNSDFKSVIENDNYFVDKSLFVKAVIDSQSQILLLPRPRRFGKTLNLSMLKYFFDVNERQNKHLFLNLKIWQSETGIKEKYQNHPVIFFSFKDAKEKTWEKCYELIVSELADLFRQHLYLLAGTLLSETEKIEFNEIINRKAKETDFQRSLKKLSEYLFRYHQQKVVILIDEYDTPIQAGYKNYYESVISFMRNLLSGAFKDNAHLYKGVLTGILRISKESIFTGLNNVSVFTVLDNEFADNFGFTEQEIAQVLLDFEVATSFEQVKKWYNGYKFGNSNNIYNPWSILNYAVSHKSGFKPFWVNTGSDDLIREQLKDKNANYTRTQFYKLINNESIEKIINENFIFPNLEANPELLWSLLVFSGYLTVEKKLGINEYALKIPNFEIAFVFKNIILDWLNLDVKIKQYQLIETTKHLINNNIEAFEIGFKAIIGDTFSYFDPKGEPENVYQSYVLGLLAILGDDYIIKSNRESGSGRYDILLIPHDRQKYGIVIEIKQIAQVSGEKPESFINRINNKIEEAKIQIDENKYYLELLANKIEKIIKLPIVFAGKEPYIMPISSKNDENR